MKVFLGFVIGVWAGGVFAALGAIAYDSGLEANALAGGHLLHQSAIVIAILGAAFVGGVFGAIVEQTKL